MSLASACNHPDSRYIFNHDIMSCTSAEVSGNYLYSGRALGLTEVDDIIQIHLSWILNIGWQRNLPHGIDGFRKSISLESSLIPGQKPG